jgi:hypothetical protein
MAYLTELELRGWTRVPNIGGQALLLDLARSIGFPVASPTGELVKEIRVTPNFRARARTLSAVYGRGEFPLHTDTAFWPTPARYIVLRVRGDTRRYTKLRAFEEVLSNCGGRILTLVDQSIWRVRGATSSFYCTLSYRLQGRTVWRYDNECMFPANRAAREVKGIFEVLMKGNTEERISWSGDDAVILSNWRVLHGRGPAPQDEDERILERVYVR